MIKVVSFIKQEVITRPGVIFLIVVIALVVISLALGYRYGYST